MNVLLTGATGLVGKEIGKKLIKNGHKVTVLTRSAESAVLECPFPCEFIEGDLNKEPIRSEKFKNIDAVIHLAGESVAEARWSQSKKQKIYHSRVAGTENLIESLKSSGAQIKVFVSTSASGYYGDQGEQILNEDSPRGSGFLSDVCRDWERAIEFAQSKNTFVDCRFVILRVGMVVSPFGGALLKMIPAFRLGLGGAVGTGRQWMGWIHIEDLSNLYIEALSNSSYSGVINAVAPEKVTNKEFSTKLAVVFGKKLGPSIPKAILKLIFGEMSHVLLSSQRIEAQVLSKLQFNYKYPSLESALKQACELYLNGDNIFFAEQFIPSPLDKVFSFFSQAKNLERITPPLLNFQVLKMSTEQIQSGSLIDYRLKVHGVPVKWQTEILDWQPPNKFTDTQRKGPYTKWHHTHEFKSFAGGVLMSDLVRYRLPMGILGWAAAGSFVAKDVRNIFDYRKKICHAVDFNKD